MKKSILVLAVAVAIFLLGDTAYAQDVVDTQSWRGSYGLGAGIAMGIAAVGGALAQGMAAKAMYESISRNPNAAGKLNAPFYVGMAMIESLVLFTFAIAFLLQGAGAA